ncbi:MAG: signal peptidase I [Lachnospiraceae bacterium]|nr:signal peptidase I [Lachnospiraceae bacterium]
MNKILREILSTGLYLLGVVCITYLVIMYVVQLTNVDGESMEPTLQDKNKIFVEKISYRFNDPKRFDIIVFPVDYKKDTFYIKRIIGLPGETIQIGEDGTIYINGEALVEAYGKEVIRAENRGIAADPIVIGWNEYFVMGDNRNDSTDSRFVQVGNIHRDEIIGRAWVRVWPLSDFEVIAHE